MARNELHQEWEKRIEDLKASGQSIVAWSIANNHKIHQVRYWLRKIQSPSQTTICSSPQWLAIKIGNSEPARQGTPLLIKVGTATIEVLPGFNHELLLEVVRVLNATC
jgi:hypothetical protein